jgi:hypothetical protein
MIDPKRKAGKVMLSPSSELVHGFGGAALPGFAYLVRGRRSPVSVTLQAERENGMMSR